MVFQFTTVLQQAYEEAIEATEAALKAEGFGVLTRVDLQATFRKKLDVDFHPSVILGACNPGLAHKALQADARVGLLLPCNVIVEQVESGVRVAAINPQSLLLTGPLAENETIQAVAAEARQRLERVIQTLAGA